MPGLEISLYFQFHYIKRVSSPFFFGAEMKPLLNKMFFNHFILLANLISTHAILYPMDFLALQSIRKSLHDLPGSNYFSSWEFTSDPCNFPGVFCQGDRVIALNLGDPRAGSPGLTGRVDPAIGTLSALTELTIVPGRIFGCLPHTISQLKNLKLLSVARNFLSGEIPAGLGQLRGMQTLDLSFNQFAGIIPPAIGRLPALSNLLLCHNRLSGSIPPFASQTLIHLDLKHNGLSGRLPPRGIPPSVQYLALSWNRLSGAVDEELSRLNQLHLIDLGMNRFSGCIPIELFNFPIANLQLQRNQFSCKIEPTDKVMIQTVDLSFNRLSGEISPMFSTVQNLYLNNNGFSGRVPSGMVERLLSSEIQVLYLHHNYLTGMDIDLAAKIPAGSSFCMQYNCMVVPVRTACPLRAGKQWRRPAGQCTMKG